MTETSFTTNDGRLLVAAFTDETERAALDELGVNLSDLARLKPSQVMRKFRKNVELLGGLAWLAAYAEVRARGIRPDEWAGLFGYAQIVSVAMAVIRAVAVRHPSSRLAETLAAIAQPGR